LLYVDSIGSICSVLLFLGAFGPNDGTNGNSTVGADVNGTYWNSYGVRHYRKVIETAAKYHIMIDNHEPVKGTGLQRTYPNLMSQEGGRGQE